MDPVTQGALGAAAAQGVAGARLGRRAALVGFVTAVLPDLDYALAPLADPAFPIEYHRHFTHALSFVPIGALLAALPFAWLARRRGWGVSTGAIFLAAFAAWLTHPLLDAFTSYGTLLFWPFSDRRVALDWIAIIDPVYTFILIVGVVASLRTRRSRYAALALVLSTGYIGVGGLQHARAQAAQRQLVEGRGHEALRARTLPTLANLVRWRSIYVEPGGGGTIHADTIRVPPHRRAHALEGEQSALVRPERLPDALKGDRRALSVFHDFERFADGYTSLVAEQPLVVGDARYSLDSGGFEPLWGVRFAVREGGPDLAWLNLMGDRRAASRRLFDVFRGRGAVPEE